MIPQSRDGGPVCGVAGGGESRHVVSGLGSTVATVGFPNPAGAGQGFAPKLARGDIAALSAPTSDVGGYFQISVPVQPALEFKLQLVRARGTR